MPLPDVKTAPVNFCVYCHKSIDETQLTDEHAIPYGLNGWLILAKASCKACATITSKFERYVLKEIFGDIRATSGMRTRRKKNRPLQLPLVDDNHPEGRMIPTTDHPGFATLPVLGPAAALRNESNGGCLPLVWPFIWQTADSDRITKLDNFNNLKATFNLNTNAFCQFLSKIAYCTAIAQFGYGSILSAIPKLILTDSPLICDYVGGSEDEVFFDRAGLHSVSCVRIDGLIKVYIALLSSYGGPRYEVVVGETTGLISAS